MDKEVISNLSYNEKRLLLALDAAGGSASPAELISEGGFQLEVEIMGSASWLQSKGLALIEESVSRSYSLTDSDSLRDGLPERRALRIIDEAGGSMALSELGSRMPGEDNIAIGWLMRKKLAAMSGEGDSKTVSLNDQGRKMLSSSTPDEDLVARMLEGPVPESEADPKAVKDLKGRKGMIKENETVARRISLTQDGTEAARSGLEVRKEEADVTDDLIQSGKWKDAAYRRYDVRTFAPAVYPAKKNPLTRLGADIRRLFTEMGFSEMASDYVQPAFWNMDALFIPQDHSARDMQDTFFLDRPASLSLGDRDLVEKIRAIHENGGDTGSRGWGGKWSEDKASQALLRTHSTVSSIRYIAEHPDAPQKAFSISRIFRKESIDATHLPEFSQIEGIVIDENASLDMLIALIREFYQRMGFDEIHVRPSYFPYTEPSLELEVFFNGKWLELGGAGVFRPEVLAPFGVKTPVLAWGFGFERLAMLKWNIKDIRELYISDIDALRGNTVYRFGLEIVQHRVQALLPERGACRQRRSGEGQGLIGVPGLLRDPRLDDQGIVHVPHVPVPYLGSEGLVRIRGRIVQPAEVRIRFGDDDLRAYVPRGAVFLVGDPDGVPYPTPRTETLRPQGPPSGYAHALHPGRDLDRGLRIAEFQGDHPLDVHDRIRPDRVVYRAEGFQDGFGGGIEYLTAVLLHKMYGIAEPVLFHEMPQSPLRIAVCVPIVGRNAVPFPAFVRGCEFEEPLRHLSGYAGVPAVVHRYGIQIHLVYGVAQDRHAEGAGKAERIDVVLRQGNPQFVGQVVLGRDQAFRVQTEIHKFIPQTECGEYAGRGQTVCDTFVLGPVYPVFFDDDISFFMQFLQFLRTMRPADPEDVAYAVLRQVIWHAWVRGRHVA